MPKQLVAKNLAPQALPTGQKNTLKISKGQHFRVQNLQEGQAKEADNLIATRQGQHLNIRYADGTELQFEGFYNECGSNACSVNIPGDRAAGYTINGDTGTGAASSSGNLVYAHGEQSTLMSMAGDDAGLSSALSASALASPGDGLLTYIPSSTAGSLDLGTLAGIGAGVGLAAAPGGDSGASGGGNVINSIVAHVQGGPILSSNDLQATLYNAAGTTVLGRGTINADGSVTVQIGSYTGVVIVKVVSTGTGLDYMDETTHTGKDLGSTALYSMGEIVNGTVYLNVNILTSLAYSKAIAAAGAGPLTTSLVSSINAAVAEAFGLPDLQGQSTVITTVDTSGSSNSAYNQNDGVSSAEKYGAILAALSGADANNGGNTQATLTTLINNFTVSGSNGTLTDAALSTLMTGAQTADPGNSQTLINVISGSTAQTSAALRINDIAGDNTLNVAEQGSVITGTGVANATVTLTLGTGNTHAVTADASGNWSYTLQSADITAMGEGAKTIHASDDTHEASRKIHIDTVAPTLAISTPISGGYLNDAEDENSLSIAGTSSGADGQTVTVNVGGTVKTRPYPAVAPGRLPSHPLSSKL